MKCVNCGNEVLYNEKICANCGENNANYIPPSPPPNYQQLSYGYGQGQPPYDNAVNNTPFVVPSVINNEKYEKFAKAGLILAISCIACFVIVLILTISIIGDASSVYIDYGALTQKLIWTGLFFIASMIVGILGIIFSGISLSKQHGKRGIAITGLVLSIIFTAICLIIYLMGI